MRYYRPTHTISKAAPASANLSLVGVSKRTLINGYYDVEEETNRHGLDFILRLE